MPHGVHYVIWVCYNGILMQQRCFCCKSCRVKDFSLAQRTTIIHKTLFIKLKKSRVDYDQWKLEHAYDKMILRKHQRARNQFVPTSLLSTTVICFITNAIVIIIIIISSYYYFYHYYYHYIFQVSIPPRALSLTAAASHIRYITWNGLIKNRSDQNWVVRCSLCTSDFI